MELGVVDRDALLVDVGPLQEQLVVHPELALGHPRQLALDVDAPGHVRLEHGSLRAEHHIGGFHHVDVDVVFFVVDAFSSPGVGGGRLHRQLLQLFCR